MKKIPLNELCEFQNGFAFSSSDYSSEGTIVLRMSNISREGRFNINSGNIKFFPKNKINGLERFLLKKNDVVIAMTDMSKDMGIIGRTAVVDEDDKYILNQRVGKFIIKSNELHYKYLHAYTNSVYFIDYVKKCCGGGLQMNISTTDIMNYEIPLPDLKTQQKIASILEQADVARQKRKQANQLTEQFLQSAFLEMFGDPLINPKGFKVVTIADLCEIRRGASPRPIDKFIGGTIPWIKIGDATAEASSLYIFKTKVHITKEGAEKSVYVPEGSLIFANCGVSLGFARIMKTGGCIHDGWLSLFNFAKEINVLFLLSWINQMTNYLRKLAPEGTQPNLNTTIMKNLIFPLPPLSLQKKFATLVEQVEQLRTKQRESEKELENLFGSLMQRYFG
jgi:type I restriction enzyme S subunit